MPHALDRITDRVLAGEALTRDEAREVVAALGGPLSEVLDVFSHASRIREAFRPPGVDICSIASAKTGGCPEDCSYCAQSSRSRTGVKSAPLIARDELAGRARRAREQGAHRFCIVTSGLTPTDAEFSRILGMVGEVREIGLLPCATLGAMTADRLAALKGAGLVRYHHNIETSERFFPEICSSHTYADKLRTIALVRASGLSLCSGGIFGMGEEWEDRIEMALALRELGADSVPLNFLVAIPGTPLADAPPLPPMEGLAIIALFRFALPGAEIRPAGGRVQALGELGALIFAAGADGLLSGDCLTTVGRDPASDLRLISDSSSAPLRSGGRWSGLR